MYKEYKMKSMPYGKCRIRLVYNEYGLLERIELKSYLTTVAVIDLADEMPVLYTTYDWKVFYESRRADKNPPKTSIRHISKFTKEFTGENLYHDLKKCDIINLNPEQVKTIVRTVVNTYIN